MDLSNNRLTGEVPTNGSFVPPPPVSTQGGNSVSSTGAIAGEWLQVLLYYLLRLQFGLHGGVAVNHVEHFFDVPAEEDPEVYLGQLTRFSLRELQVATDSFSNKNILWDHHNQNAKERLVELLLLQVQMQGHGRAIMLNMDFTDLKKEIKKRLCPSRGKFFEASYSMHALIESCVRCSEAR